MGRAAREGSRWEKLPHRREKRVDVSLLYHPLPLIPTLLPPIITTPPAFVKRVILDGAIRLHPCVGLRELLVLLIGPVRSHQVFSSQDGPDAQEAGHELGASQRGHAPKAADSGPPCLSLKPRLLQRHGHAEMDLRGSHVDCLAQRLVAFQR